MEKIKSRGRERGREGGREWSFKKKKMTMMMMMGTLDEVFYRAAGVEGERVVQHTVCLSIKQKASGVGRARRV